MIEYESVEEFIGRGGVVKQCRPHKAHNAQKTQKIKCPNSFALGRKVFSIGTGSKGVTSKRPYVTERSEVKA